MRKFVVVAAILAVASLAYAASSSVLVVSATEVSGTANDKPPVSTDAGLPLTAPQSTGPRSLAPVTFVQLSAATTLIYPDAGPDQLTYGSFQAWKYTPNGGWARYPDLDVSLPAGYNIDGGTGQTTFTSKPLTISVAGPGDRIWFTTLGVETGMDAGILTVQVEGQVQGPLSGP